MTNDTSKVIELTLLDITTALQIIDAAQSRGAIRPDEMVVAGTCRNRLSEFLEYQSKKASTEDDQ